MHLWGRTECPRGQVGTFAKWVHWAEAATVEGLPEKTEWGGGGCISTLPQHRVPDTGTRGPSLLGPCVDGCEDTDSGGPCSPFLRDHRPRGHPVITRVCCHCLGLYLVSALPFQSSSLRLDSGRSDWGLDVCSNTDRTSMSSHGWRMTGDSCLTLSEKTLGHFIASGEEIPCSRPHQTHTKCWKTVLNTWNIFHGFCTFSVCRQNVRRVAPCGVLSSFLEQLNRKAMGRNPWHTQGSRDLWSLRKTGFSKYTFKRVGVWGIFRYCRAKQGEGLWVGRKQSPCIL